MNLMTYLTRMACGLLLLLEVAAADPLPSLVLGTDPKADITWKQVFDSGFRPKYLGRMTMSDCEIVGQSMAIKLDPAGPGLELPPGRIRFQMMEGTTLRMIWHQGRDPLTMQEGAREVQRFKDVFGALVDRDIQMPRRIDPSGLVDARNEENNIRARLGRYMILYGFDNSYRADKPLIPHFYIFLQYPDMPRLKGNPMSYKIPPPEGYEWYSLDPAIDTPEPGVRKAAVAPGMPKPANGPVAVNTAQSVIWNAGWLIGWILLIVAALVVAGILIWRMRRKTRSGQRPPPIPSHRNHEDR